MAQNNPMEDSEPRDPREEMFHFGQNNGDGTWQVLLERSDVNPVTVTRPTTVEGITTLPEALAVILGCPFVTMARDENDAFCHGHDKTHHYWFVELIMGFIPAGRYGKDDEAEVIAFAKEVMEFEVKPIEEVEANLAKAPETPPTTTAQFIEALYAATQAMATLPAPTGADLN